jgi:tetratricopeptide (TPR) repeat protein
MNSYQTGGNHLAYWRKQRNMSLSKLSLKMGHENYVSTATLMRWEKGTIKDWAIPILAKILKISEMELLEGPQEPVKTTAGNVSLAYLGLDEELAESIINMGYTSWIASRPNEAKKAVQQILPILESVNRHNPSNKGNRYTLARGYELLGALALDRVDDESAYDSAFIEFRRALALSEEIQDINLIAAHMTEIGEVYRRKGDLTKAIQIMESALALARKGEKTTIGYVLEMLAYTYVENNNQQAFRYHIEEAIDLLGYSGNGRGVSQREFVPFEVYEIYGKGLRDFGHAQEALTYLEKAEQTLLMQPSMPRWQAVVSISKAQALCDAGEIEEGLALAERGFSIAHNCQSPRQMHRVRKLSRRLKEEHGSSLTHLVTLEETIHEIDLGHRQAMLWQRQHAM